MTLTIQPRVERDKLLRLLGGRRQSSVSFNTQRRLDKWGDRMSDLIDSSLTYVVREIENVEGREIHVKGLDEPLISAKIGRTVADCSHLVFFIGTIGTEIDRRVHHLNEDGKISDLYVLDAMGSVAVEDLVDQFQGRMERQLKAEGKSVTLRFSPGYCDWPIDEQEKLFRLFGNRHLPVRLTETFLMQPRKSVSGLFGIRPVDDGSSIFDHNPCMECPKTNCIARRREA